jgi:hypothetical protein
MYKNFSVQITTKIPYFDREIKYLDFVSVHLASVETGTHHGGKCIDGCAYQAGVIRIPPTNFTFIDEYVNVSQLRDLSGQ